MGVSPVSDPLAVTREQFTLQAAAFAAAPAMRNQEALQFLVRCTAAGSEDTVLDVACGPGLVACALAATARSVTGIDLTPAMIERARGLQRAQGRENLHWQVGTVCPLPFPDEHFSRVVCRYAAHHFEDPAAVVREMARVCRCDGYVVLADVVVPEEAALAENFNRMERLRDPSHVRALSRSEIDAIAAACRLAPVVAEKYRLPMELDGLLAASFPVPGGAEQIRALLAESVGHDRLGVAPYRDGSSLRFSFPIEVFVWRKPSK